MEQTLHLLILDHDRRAALAATCGSKWLLPVVTCGERTRALPLIARWLTQRGVHGDVAGQWLGCVTGLAIDWLVAIATKTGFTTDDALEWMPFESFASSAPVLEYQQWAIARTLARGARPSINGPFGNLSWPGEVREWIGRAVGSRVSSLTPYRAGAHEVVIGADFAHGRVYFKGLAEERAIEARVTQALAAVEPASFARTLALEHRADGSVFWLTAACPGRSGGPAHRIAQALARIQQRVLATSASRELRRLDLEAAARWASALLGDSPSSETVRGHCAQVSGADVPATWIPMDLDPTNVLTDEGGRVCFIDVDDSFHGPAPLAMATLAQRCGDRTVYRTYERSWSPPRREVDWDAFETAATVIHSWLGWTRLERNVARGEVFVDRDLAAARMRARLARAIGGISPSQARQDGPAA
jgi:hypothetical protein